MRWFILFIASSIWIALLGLIGFGSYLLHGLYEFAPRTNDAGALLSYVSHNFFVLHLDVTLSTIATILVVIILLFYLVHIIYRVSLNITAIEIDKYSKVARQRMASGCNEPLTNFYDKGFFKNWASVIGGHA